MIVGNFDEIKKNHYQVILADPPWHFRTYGPKGRNRSPDWKPMRGAAARHYNTMNIDDICKIPVADIAADDCVLFIWICWPMLAEAFKLIEAWGFTYKTCAFSWTKANAQQFDMFRDDMDVQVGMGYWTRSNNEVCLLAVKGKPKRIKKDVRQAIIEPRRQHSRKPDCVYERIERLMEECPKIELFSRTQRNGWDAFGDQTEKFKTPASDQRGIPAHGSSKPQKRKKHDDQRKSNRPSRKVGSGR